MYRAYVGVISRCIVSNEYVPLCVRDHAWRYYWNTQTEHCSISRCPPRKVSEWRGWIWGLLLKSGAIRSILDTDSQKAEAIDVDGYLEEKTAHAIWLWAVRVQTFRTESARTSITRHSLMPMIPSESSILIWEQLYMFHILQWLLINACNNEDYAKTWTRPHLDTLHFPMTPMPVWSLPLYSFSTFYYVF